MGDPLYEIANIAQHIEKSKKSNDHHHHQQQQENLQSDIGSSSSRLGDIQVQCPHCSAFFSVNLKLTSRPSTPDRSDHHHQRLKMSSHDVAMSQSHTVVDKHTTISANQHEVASNDEPYVAADIGKGKSEEQTNDHDHDQGSLHTKLDFRQAVLKPAIKHTTAAPAGRVRIGKVQLSSPHTSKGANQEDEGNWRSGKMKFKNNKRR